MAATFETQAAKLQAELTQYVGSKQADHTRRMIEDNLRSECIKVGGRAWFRRICAALERTLTEPQARTLRQTSPETESWGGFLSHDVSVVRGPSLRANPDWKMEG